MKRRQPGLTLAETLVSLTLLSLLAVAVLNLFPSSLTIVRITRTGWLARAAAQDRVERLASQPFPTLDEGYSKEEKVTLRDGAVAELRTTITKVDGYDPKFLKRIRCDISWEGRAALKSASHEFYVHSVRR